MILNLLLEQTCSNPTSIQARLWVEERRINRLAGLVTVRLVSAAPPDINFLLDVAEVIAVMQAGDADIHADACELGCSLD